MSIPGQLPPLTPNTVLAKGRYTIERVLGAGGFGYVYLARDRQQQPVAIKQCIDLDPQTITQFGHELAVLKTLAPQSKYFPQVIEEFSEQLPGALSAAEPKYMFAVMEFVPGRTLESELEERLARGAGAFSENDVVVWITQVLEALDAAHSRNPPIIHRDIKPANIMLLPGGQQIKIIDVGIAKIGGAGTKTQRGAAAASPGFAPPEQYAQSSQTDRFSDIYAVGATMYYLLTGVAPADAMARSSGVQALTPLRTLNSTVSPLLEGVVVRALEIDVARRYQAAAEMLAALQGKAALPSCPQCGTPNQPNARFCQKCGATLQSSVLKLAGSQVQTMVELAAACDRSWVEAVGYLTTGKIDQWLRNLGQAGQTGLGVLQQMRAQFPNDPNLQLDGFLAQIEPQRSPAQLQIQSATPPLTTVEQGSSHSTLLTVANVGRGYLAGTISANEPWVVIKPTTIQCAANQAQTVNIVLETASLAGSRTGRQYMAQIYVRTNGGNSTLMYQLQVTAAPLLSVTPLQLDFGSLQYGQDPVRPLQVNNNGAGALAATLQAAVPWIHVTAPSVNVAAHTHQTVNVQVLTRRLSERKTHTGELYVNANHDGIATVQVTLALTGPYSPSCDPNAAIQHVGALVTWCDTHWQDAVQLLRSGELYAAASYLGEPARGILQRRNSEPWPTVLGRVQQAATLPDANIALESALRALGAEPPEPSDNWSDVQRELGLGLMPDPRWMMPWWEGPRQVTFTIRNEGRGYLHGRLQSLAAWLVVDIPDFGCRAGQAANVIIRVYKKRRRLRGLSPELFDLQID